MVAEVRARLVLAIAVLRLSTVIGAGPASAAAQADDNAYTSPTYGYTLKWNDEIWDVGDESSAAEFQTLSPQGERAAVTFQAYEEGDGETEASGLSRSSCSTTTSASSKTSSKASTWRTSSSGPAATGTRRH